LKLYLSRMHFPISALGFGRRIGVWFQGCSIHCDGCISVDTWTPKTGETTISDVLESAAPWLMQADGITISGGEPFDQFPALQALLRELRPRTAGDVLVFSGYPYEQLAPELEQLSGLVDAIITDPFDARQPQTLALRGSNNQRLHRLTALGRARYVDEAVRANAPLDLMVDTDGTVWLAGIPRRGDLERLRAVLRRTGFDCETSERPGAR
jgi:anaerobic ribonucleoside-triphosphate reductase activating protein